MLLSCGLGLHIHNVSIRGPKYNYIKVMINQQGQVYTSINIWAVT